LESPDAPPLEVESVSVPSGDVTEQLNEKQNATERKNPL
jgi:hypothetical protein